MGSYVGAGSGVAAVFNSFAGEGRGTFAVLIPCTGALTGLHRIANDALDRYELFRGVDASPDLTAAAWETFSTLPHVSAALDADATYHFVLRDRNKYGLSSQNIEETLLEIDAGGDLVATPPSAPDDVAIAANGSGAITLTASYQYLEDGTDAATQFLIFLTDDDTAPDPDEDEPTVVTMTKADGVAKLDWDSSGHGDAAVIRVVLRTRRIDAGPANVDSTNTAEVTATTSTSGPAAPTGDLLIGNYQQRQ